MLRNRLFRLGLNVLAVGLLLGGCTPAAGDAPAVADGEASEGVPVVSDANQNGIFAEAIVEPARVITLRAGVGGKVLDIGADEGESVPLGMLLVRIDDADAQLGVRRAEAGLEDAQAQLAVAQAGTRDEQIAVLAGQVAAADAEVARLTAQRDITTAGIAEADAIDAQAALLRAELAHEAADESHDDTMVCYDIPTADGGEREYCPTLGTLEEMARARMEAAYAGLQASRAQLDAVLAGQDPAVAASQASVETAIAARQAAEAQLALAEAGARREVVAVTAAGVAQAQAGLAQAQEALEMYRIEVPFDATLVDLLVSVGDTIAPGTPVATLATLDRLQVRTTDLTELDVTQVAPGDSAAVTFDAVPDEPLSGAVIRIDPLGTPQFGDVIYDVLIALDSVPDWVRWGMSAEVDVGISEMTPESSLDAGRVVIAEGTVTPDVSSGLQFLVGGEIADVSVAVGDHVAVGDVVARLDDENQRLALAGAEAALATAEARLALAKASPQAEAIAAAEADLAAAMAGLQQAVAARDQALSGVVEAEVSGVEAQLAQAMAERRQLQAARVWAEDGGDYDRADDMRDQMHVLDVAIAGFEARLKALPVVGDGRLRMANAGVRAADAQVEVAQAALDLAMAGPTDEDIAVAAAAVAGAKVEVGAAQLALDRTLLTAPFDGTLTRVDMEVGDMISPGQPVAVLGDLSQLRVETVDLTELDVVAVDEGQRVEIAVDALPGDTWLGHIRRIDDQSTLMRGDVTYTAIVDLDEEIPGLRWGMTVAVTID